MVIENSEIYTSEMAKKSSTMLGENFEIYTSDMAKYAPKILHHGWRKF